MTISRGPGRWSRAEAVLASAVDRQAFPCAVAEVGRQAGVIWNHATGRLTYAADAPPATPATIFDLASLTKVLATSTLALQLSARATLMLDTRVATVVPRWRGADREAVTVRDLLEHASGLPDYRAYFHTRRGRDQYEQAIAAEPLEYAPRSRSIYSDLGFMLLGFVLERAGDARLDVQFDRWRAHAGIDGPLAYGTQPEWRARTAPTEDDPWRGRLVHGDVHDQNAAALDGVAAHAGLFGTAAACGACARWWLARLAGRDDPATGITAQHAAMFVQRSTVARSSRALGWDTMRPTSSCGARLSTRAVGHTGFTGTSLWLDPARDLYLVLLTNRVHLSRNNDAIQAVRRAFHDAVLHDLEGPG